MPRQKQKGQLTASLRQLGDMAIYLYSSVMRMCGMLLVLHFSGYMSIKAWVLCQRFELEHSLGRLVLEITYEEKFSSVNAVCQGLWDEKSALRVSCPQWLAAGVAAKLCICGGISMGQRVQELCSVSLVKAHWERECRS